MEYIATMVNNTGDIGEMACVKDCTTCVKAKHTFKNYKGEQLYSCRMEPSYAERLSHKNCVGCQYHMSAEEQAARRAMSSEIVKVKFSALAVV